MITRRQLGSAALGAASLVGTRGNVLAQAPRKGGDVVIAISQAPPSLDAHITSAQVARNVNLHMYETLFARDESAKAVPELAEGVNISGDGLTYTFPIRKGVKFHNGKELDAKDVAASIERYRKVGASPALVAAIDKIDASGPSEVTLRLKQPQSTFLENISSPRAPIAIYPASEAAKDAGKIEFIGTGPYKFVEYRPDSHVKIARYDGYSANPKGKQERDGFAGKKEAFIDSVTFRFMPEAGARVAALEAGEIHCNETIDGPTAKRLANDKRFTIYKALPFALQVIKFNHAQAPGNDVNFRRAVQAALDMEEIMAIAYADIYQMDPSWLYPGHDFHTKAGGEKFNQANLKLGKELLAKSSYKGEKLIFIVDNIRPNTDTATVVQQRLKEIGINVEVSVADWPTVSKVGYTPQGWNFWAHGFGIEPYEGPASVMAPWIAGLSLGGAKDQKIDEIAAAFALELDEGKRKALFDQFQKHLYDDAVVMKAGNYGIFQAATVKLKNFVPYRIPRMWGTWLEA